MTTDNTNRTIADIIAQTGAGLKALVRTRVEILMSELYEKAEALKIVVSLASLSLVLLLTGYILFIVALVALAAIILRSTSSPWLFACLVVAGLTSILGLMAALFARRSWQMWGVFPIKTFAVLKADKIWLQAEVRNQT